MLRDAKERDYQVLLQPEARGPGWQTFPSLSSSPLAPKHRPGRLVPFTLLKSAAPRFVTPPAPIHKSPWDSGENPPRPQREGHPSPRPAWEGVTMFTTAFCWMLIRVRLDELSPYMEPNLLLTEPRDT